MAHRSDPCTILARVSWPRRRQPPSRRRQPLWVLALVAALLSSTLSACGGETQKPGEDAQDTRIDRYRPPNDEWTTGLVESGNVGDHPSLAVSSSGTVGVAYFGTRSFDDGLCSEIPDDPPPMKVRWTLKYAELAGDTWTPETVLSPIGLAPPPGVSLRMLADGTPALAAMAGEPVAQLRFCGANDLVLMRRTAPGTWSEETAVSTSGQAATGAAASDYGEVVGYWPALAVSSTGELAIAYKDVHAGGMQSDDFRRADLELAWQRGGWQALPVDFGRGAGNYNAMLFDAQDRPVIAYYTPTEDLDAAQIGVWVTRSADGGATWERVQLFNQATSEGPAIALDVDGALNVVWYASTLGFPQRARLVDDTAFTSVADGWELENLGDNLYDEGYQPSLALSPTGTLAMAYFRCGRSTAGLGDCSVNDDGLVFSWKNGATWEVEVVDDGGVDGLCGRNPSLAFAPDGSALIAYGCERRVDSALVAELKFARREPLP